MTNDDDQHRNSSRLVGIPVRLREETVLDRNVYMALVDSVRAHVAAFEDEGKVDLSAAEHAWLHVCNVYEDKVTAGTALAVKHFPEARDFMIRAIKDEPAVQVYMAFSRATVDQVVDGLMAFAAADHGPMPAPPIGEPTP